MQSRSAGLALDARFLWFLAGSAVLLGVASVWVLMHFSPSGLSLGFAASRPRATASRLIAGPAPASPAQSPSSYLVAEPTSAGQSVTASASATPSARSSALKPLPRPRPAPPATPVHLPSSAVGPPLRLQSSPPAGPTVTGTPATPAPSTSAVAPPVPPVTVDPVNGPSVPVQIGSVLFGSQAGVVTLDGLRPTDRTLQPPSTFIDWGDGAGRKSSASTQWSGAGTIDLTHTYAEPGTYTIVWGYTTDTDHVWTHTVTVSAAAGAPPTASLQSASAQGDTQQFGFADTATWASWTLDYGDGSSVSGAGTEPSADQASHSYDGSGHLAVLTVVGADGQLQTGTLATP